MIEQEKSRAMLMIDERPVRNSVLVISRTIASKRCASTAISVGSSSRAAGAPAGSLAAAGSDIVQLQSVVAELADVRRPTGIYDDRRLGLDHERRAGDARAWLDLLTKVHVELDLAELGEVGDSARRHHIADGARLLRQA